MLPPGGRPFVEGCRMVTLELASFHVAPAGEDEAKLAFRPRLRLKSCL
jgi:hypothetical protein